jgi:hypothetical protein
MDRPSLSQVIKSWKQGPPYEGVRVCSLDDFVGMDDLDWMNLEIIWDALEWQEFLIFEYSGKERLVAPFVLGISSEGNPLVRGFQVEGESLGGEGYGWRVFQLRKMSMVDLSWEYFDIEDFEFNNFYPWTYKAFRTL